MKIYNRDLKKGRRLIASGRYSQAVSFLVDKVPLFQKDPVYYDLIGRAYLGAGLLKDADDFLNIGLQCDPSHLDIRLVLAVTHLKRKNTSAALRVWLEILDDYPREPYASRGLKTLKRFSSPERQDRFLQKFDPLRYMPRLSSPWPGRIMAVLAVILVLLTAVYFRDNIQRLFQRGEQRPGTALFSGVNKDVPETDTAAASGPDAVFDMSEREISKTLKKAMQHYRHYEDNSARYELNKILSSNAPETVQNRVKSIVESLGEADINTLETSYTYEEVVEQPFLYNGCLVLWKGRTANIRYEGDAIRFDFLVGFEDQTVLKGRLPVEVLFPVVMEPLPLELLAAVQITDDNSIRLSARTLHFLR